MSDARGTESESCEQGDAGNGRESADVQRREAGGLRESVCGGFGGGESEERG